MISALMPNYARADLAFERGEGAWLWTVDGRRFLDFGSGIATASLGPRPSASGQGDRRAGRQGDARLQPVSHPAGGTAGAAAGRRTFADSVFFCNSGAEANEGMIKMMRRAMYDARQAGTLPVHLLRGRVSRPHAGDARRHRQREIPARLRPGGGRLRPRAVQQHERGARRDRARHLPASSSSRSRARAACARPTCSSCATCARCATSTAWSSAWTRCSPAWAAPASCSPMNGPASTPDVMSAAKGIGGGFPLGAVLAKETVAKHLVPGTHGTTFGGNPLACAAGNAVLDVMLAPGFLEDVERKGRKLRAELDEIAREYPAGLRGCARHGPAARAEMRAAAGRSAGRLRRRGADGDHRRRQRAAPGAAAGGHRRRNGRGGRHAAPRHAARAAVAPPRPRRNERLAPYDERAVRAGPPKRWPARATSSTCATSTPRRCGRCWTWRRTTSAAACRRARWPARRWR